MTTRPGVVPGGPSQPDATPFDLHVERWGDGEGMPLVLVHGFGASNHSWRHWIPHLARTHTVFALELTGFGRAPCPAGAVLSPEAQSTRLVGWLRARGLRAPILVGHSLGAPVILMAALRLLEGRPELVPGGLVVVSGAVFEQRYPPYISAARIPGLGEALMSVAPPRTLLRQGIRGIVGDPSTVTHEMVEGYRAPLLDAHRRRTILRAARAIRRTTAGLLAPRYPRLTMPVLALWGAQDPVIPPEFAARLASVVPRGRAELLDGVGHLPQEEAPWRSLAVLTDWMTDLPRDPSARQEGDSEE